MLQQLCNDAPTSDSSDSPNPPNSESSDPTAELSIPKPEPHSVAEKAVIDEPDKFVAYHEEDAKQKDIVADKFDPKAETKRTTVQEVPGNWMILDIGPASTMLFAEALDSARTIIWNGPMGAFEMDAFSRGTMAMVQKLATSHALTIVGGGDTDVAVHRAGESNNISYISTGGGAFLMLMEGKVLPGVQALEDK